MVFCHAVERAQSTYQLNHLSSSGHPVPSFAVSAHRDHSLVTQHFCSSRVMW